VERLKSPKTKLFLTLIATLLGGGLIVYLVPFGEVVKTIREISPKALLSGLVLYSVSYLLRALRWKVYYPRASLGYLFLTTAVNTFLNNTLPMRLGELSVFGFLRRYDPDAKTTAKKFLKVRLYDATALLTLLTFAALTLKTNALVGTVGAAAVYPALLLLSRTLKVAKIPPLRFEPLTFAYSVGALLTKLLAVYSVLEFLRMDFVKFTAGFLGGELSSILPVNAVANLGTYESGFSLALKLLAGEEFREGFRVALLSHAFLLFASALLGGVSLIYLLRKTPLRGLRANRK
jgi:uncharacterized membrane protein YbhN (UPF0104 family)